MNRTARTRIGDYAGQLRGAAGLTRSLAIYYGMPWRARALRRFYRGIIGPGDLAFDIGAHVGNRTRALRAVGATVVAVEPQALFHRWLAATLPRDVVLQRVAVGASAGELELAVSRRHPTVSSGSADWLGHVADDPAFAGVAWDMTETVEQTTLDALIALHGRPRFCKIDVEGMEPEVLAGLSQPIPWIAIEYVPAALDRARACLDRLAALGDCRINAVRGEATRFAWDEWLPPHAAAERLAAMAADGHPGDLYARFG
ncbi:MAG: FkbM family methyltransferase [Halofilum sp. (in: g-proteobacteria)]|nr:FkbM family methyltransferase [Halofilum sp. (in: g-proteobacteria)]